MVTLIWAWHYAMAWGGPRGGWNRSHDQVANLHKKILSIAALQKGSISSLLHTILLFWRY